MNSSLDPHTTYKTVHIITLYLVLFIVLIFGAGMWPKEHPVPIPQMPTHVDVNGTQWRIQQTDTLYPGYLGYTECDVKVIFLLKSAWTPKENLMHELTHAAVCMDAAGSFTVNNMYYNSTTNEAHEGIEKYNQVWAELLHRNPELAAYLGSKD